MRKLNILMPLAGLGKRFSDEGFTLPKPLIPVDGIPMFQKSLKSFTSEDFSMTIPIDKIITVIRREHQTEFQLADKLKNAHENLEVVIIERPTLGAAETCLFAIDHCNPDDALIVLDCDLWFYSPGYLGFIDQILKQQDPHTAGALAYFEANEPRYSFIKSNGESITEIREKVAISNQAVIGAYFFSKAEFFFKEAKSLINDGLESNKEYYISVVISRLLNQGHQFNCYPSGGYFSFGTPEELNTYLNRQA